MWSFAPFLVAVMFAASTGVLFQPGSWYRALDKPPWTPPDWLFGPAWTLLYLAIAVAGWQLWQASGELFSVPMLWWGAQLVFNIAWSWLFFGARRPVLALGDALLMLAAILAFIVSAYPVSPLAAWLFVPYAVWVAFAAALNLAIWRRNDWSPEARARWAG